MNDRTLGVNERELVNFEPDEVCVVIPVDGVDEGAAPRLQAALRRRARGNVIVARPRGQAATGFGQTPGAGSDPFAPLEVPVLPAEQK